MFLKSYQEILIYPYIPSTLQATAVCDSHFAGFHHFYIRVFDSLLLKILTPKSLQAA